MWAADLQIMGTLLAFLAVTFVLLTTALIKEYRRNKEIGK